MKYFYPVIFIVIATLFNPLSGYCQAGILDPAFGSGGKTFTSFSGSDQSVDMALQSNNKIIVVGTSTESVTAYTSFALSRYNTDGSIDTSFGKAGKVITKIGVFNYASAMVLQSDGKIVVAGKSAVPDSNITFALARYNVNGSLDISFGSGGTQITKFGMYCQANAIVIQTDGKIVLAGTSADSNYTTYFALARYNTDGTPDKSFGNQGTLTTAIQNNDKATAMLLQSDGKIVVAGVSTDSKSNKSFAIVRYNINGSLDINFGNGGKQITATGTADEATAMVLQPDGKILVTGTSYNNYNGSFEVIRYKTNGTPDSSFGTNGIKISLLGTNDEANALTVQGDGKIVVAGVTADAVYNRSFALTRYNTDGSLDATFGNGGQTSYHLAPATSANAMATKWRGFRIYVAGQVTVGSNQTFALASVINNNIVLPLTWLGINASIKNRNGLIHFSTVNESNVQAFNIERSTDGVQYQKVGIIAANNTIGNHQYSFLDTTLIIAQSTEGPIYYRVKEIDKDGQFNFSIVVTLTQIHTNDLLLFYPNPVNETAKLTINLKRSQKVKGIITDFSGKKIQEQIWNLLAGNNLLTVNVNKLLSGIYYLQLKGETVMENIRFIKN